MKRFISILMLFAVLGSFAKDLPLHCGQESENVSDIIQKLEAGNKPLNQRMVMAAELLEGAGLDDYYRTDSVAGLRINVHSFIPLMFINNVIALAKTSERPGYKDLNTFSDELVDIACRRGINDGFPSIMYHGADWIGDNVSRGNIQELTENYAGAVAHTKSLDEMTRNRKDYAALADSTTFETVRLTEMGFRTHRIPALKKETIKKKDLVEDLQDGDIIILVPNRDGIDIYDAGIVSIENEKPYLIHLSPVTHEVVKEKDDLARYMSLMTKHFKGYRILRIKD